MRFLSILYFFAFFCVVHGSQAQVDTLFKQTDSVIASTLSPADSMIKIAEHFIGTPYRLGGHTKSGFDCSGFVHYLYAKFHVQLAYSCTGIAASCDKIERSEVKKGDLVFFKGRNIRSRALGHVSVVHTVDSTGIKIIHATRRGVIIDQLYKSAYYKPRLLFFARPKESMQLISKEKE